MAIRDTVDPIVMANRDERHRYMHESYAEPILGEDHQRLDGLPEPDLVGEESAPVERPEDLAGGLDLVAEGREIVAQQAHELLVVVHDQ